MELMQRLHDDGDEWQVELSHMGSDLRFSEARVWIMAAQQGVYGADGLFVEEEHTVEKWEKRKNDIIMFFTTANAHHQNVSSIISDQLQGGRFNINSRWSAQDSRTYPSPSGSRMSESSVSTRPDRKCCWRNGTDSSNMVATPWSCTMLENAELCRRDNSQTRSGVKVTGEEKSC